MNIKQEKGESLSVFISHRHKDKYIADMFREAIENWSNCEIMVYQSSNAQTASRIGDKLDDSIKTALANVNIVLLIYTAADHDRAWCMYECGLAQDPATMKTRIVVFHTSDNPPEPLRHLITVPMSKEDIKKFAENLKFNNLVERWRKESKYPKLNWDDEVYEEMTKAMLNRKEGAISTPFNSVEPESTEWFLPIISSFRVVPDEKIMEFIVLLCRIQSKVAEIMIK